MRVRRSTRSTVGSRRFAGVGGRTVRRTPIGVLHRPPPRHRRPPLLPLTLLLLVAIAGGLWLARPRATSRPPITPPDRYARAARTPDPGPGSTPDVVTRSVGDGIKISTYLGGAARRSYGLGPAPSRLDLVWKRKLGSGVTRRKIDDKPVWWAGSGWTGQPTVVTDGGRDFLLIGGYDHNLHRIDAATGKVVWEYGFDDVIKGTSTVIEDPGPARPEDRILVVGGSRRGSGYRVGDRRIAPLRAVSFATGREVWRLPVPKTANYSQDVDASPLLIDGVLYAAVEPGFVYALDPFRRERVGDHYQPIVLRRSPRLFTDADAAAHPDLGQANVALEASPSRLGNVLYVASGSGHVYGLRLPSLEVVWDFETGSDIDGTPVIGRDGRIVQAIEKEYTRRDGGVFGLDPALTPGQAPLWFFPTDDRGLGEWAGGVVGSVAVSDESDPEGTHPRLAAFMSVDGSLRVIAPDSATTLKAAGPGAKTASPVPVEVFRDPVGGSISTPIIVGDRLIAAGYDRKVHLYRIRYTKTDAPGALRSPSGDHWTVRIRETDTFSAGGPFESTPIVWGGRVYIGCRDGYLYCLGDR